MNSKHSTARQWLALILIGILALGLIAPAHAAQDGNDRPYELAKWICKHEEGRDPLKCEHCRAAWKKLYNAEPPKPADAKDAAPALSIASDSAPQAVDITAQGSDLPAVVEIVEVKAAANANSSVSTDINVIELPQEPAAQGTPAQGETRTVETPAQDGGTKSTTPTDDTTTDPVVPVDPVTPANPVDPPTTVPLPDAPASPEGGNAESGRGQTPTAPQAEAVSVVSIACSPAEVTVGDSVKLSATLDTGDARGSVRFIIGGMTLNATVVGSTASATWQPMQAGTATISALYVPAADEANAAGESASIEITVAEKTAGESGSTPVSDAVAPIAGIEMPLAEGESRTGVVTLAAPLPPDLSKATVTTVGAYTYTGKAQTPQLQVVINNKTLTLDKDYTFYALGNNTTAGSATYVIMGINGYTGTKSGAFTIQPAPASTSWRITLAETAYVTDGATDRQPAVASVTGLEGEAIAAAAYTGPTYPAASAAEGTYTVTLTAKSGTNYTGTATATYTVLAAATQITLTDATTTVTWPTPSYVSSGVDFFVSASPVEPVPAVSVKLGSGETISLTKDTDFTVAYSPASHTPTATPQICTATITGKGNYTGTLAAYSYTVVAPKTAGLAVIVDPATASYTYTGLAHTPSVIVKDTAGATLASGDYTLSYADNINAGTATITVTGAGAYAGVSGSTAFTIGKRPVQMALRTTVSGDKLILTAQITGSINMQNAVSFQFTMNGTTQTGTAAVDAYGNASWIVPFTSPGSYTISASHPGDTNHSASSGTLTSTTRVPTVSVSITENGLYGEYATIYVSVNGGVGQPIATGAVVLKLDGKEIARLTLQNGRAIHTVWGQSVLSRRQEIIAEYLGDSNYAVASSKPAYLWDYNKLFPTITLATSVGSGSKPTTLTATVASSSRWYERPTGTVTFFNGERTLGTAVLDWYGKATFTWTNVPNGTHTVYAVYNGNDIYRGATATAKITKRSGSSSGSSSNSNKNSNDVVGTIVTVPSNRSDADILLYDANGIVQHTYNTAALSPQSGGGLPLETSRVDDFYSYGVMLSRLRALSGTNGYFNAATPSFNVRIPFSFASGLEDLSAYLQRKGLSESNTEVRVIVRRIEDSSLEASFKTHNPDTEIRAAYRVEIALYSGVGLKEDYVPTSITSPMEFLVPVTGDTGIARGYDEQTRTFFDAPVEFSNNAARVTVSQNAIYIVAQ